MQGKESRELRLGLESCEMDRSERFLSEVRKRWVHSVGLGQCGSLWITNKIMVALGHLKDSTETPKLAIWLDPMLHIMWNRLGQLHGRRKYFQGQLSQKSLLLALPEVTLGHFIISPRNMEAYFKHLERKGTMKGTEDNIYLKWNLEIKTRVRRSQDYRNSVSHLSIKIIIAQFNFMRK